MTAGPVPERPRDGGRRSSRPTRRLLGIAAIAAALVAGVLVWLLVRDGGGSGRASPTAVSLGELQEVAASVGHPVYWAGPRPGATYELTRTDDGRLYIRYLPPGVDAGDPRALFPAIGTYPKRGALASLRAASREGGTRPIRLPGGGLALQDDESPTSVYLAYPGSDYEIEVFDPSPARARRLVTSGRVVPIEGASTARAVTVERLRDVARSAGHPVYWAGAQAGATYELTRTADGSVYVRYLPPGVDVGDPNPSHLTVGTYPQRDAFASLQAAAKSARAKTVPVAGGGLLFVDPRRPTSAYVAYPGGNVQIEVYDPSPGRARRLVTSGQIGPIG